jgi:hypothetical protein
MGLSEKVPKLEVGAGAYSQTARLLDEWALAPGSTVGGLLEALNTLGREDAVEAVLSGCSLYRYSKRFLRPQINFWKNSYNANFLCKCLTSTSVYPFNQVNFL